MPTLAPPRIGEFTPLVEELSPAPDAWILCKRLAALPHLLFLDSAGGPKSLRRFSYVTADPYRWIAARGRNVSIRDKVTGHPPRKITERGDPFLILKRELAEHTTVTIEGLPPFQGGAAGLFGYDLCHHLERLPRPAVDEFQSPDMAVGLFDWVIAFDHFADCAWLISTGLPEKDAAARAERAERRGRHIMSILDGAWGDDVDSVFNNAHWPIVNRTEEIRPDRLRPVPKLPGLYSNFSREEYLATIRRAVEYIHAGDCFQVNVAQRLLYPARISPMQLYGNLRRRNPAPFAGYFDMGDFVLACASPEQFVRVADGCVQTCPIKGTRPRGITSKEDQAQARELLRSEKDRAENVMIVDLLRNDLGRVCTYRSVRVKDVCRLESYQSVHHLVSEVRGRLRDDLGPIDLLRASFPGGSVTGAPKIRAMEIIAELEKFSRGPYCGSLGYIGYDGQMDSNILIRTFTIGKGWVQLPVGGGIVADSDPENEYEETWHKAKASLQALEEVALHGNWQM